MKFDLMQGNTTAGKGESIRTLANRPSACVVERLF